MKKIKNVNLSLYKTNSFVNTYIEEERKAGKYIMDKKKIITMASVGAGVVAVSAVGAAVANSKKSKVKKFTKKAGKAFNNIGTMMQGVSNGQGPKG